MPYYSRIISEIAKQMRPDIYLEIGVFQCVTFNEVSKHAKVAIGSDLVSTSSDFFKNPSQELIVGDTKLVASILKNRGVLIDLVFIDANHEKDYVVADFQALEPLLNKNALVIFHDTYPGTQEQTSQEFCGDAYMAIPLLRAQYQNYSFVTLPIHPGLTFATKTTDLPLWLD